MFEILLLVFQRCGTLALRLGTNAYSSLLTRTTLGLREHRLVLVQLRRQLLDTHVSLLHLFLKRYNSLVARFQRLLQL